MYKNVIYPFSIIYNRIKHKGDDRLQAVPFWLVQRVRSQRNETGAGRNKPEQTGGEAGRKGTLSFPFPFFPPLSKPPSACSLCFSRSAILRDLSTIQKGTACSTRL